MKPSLNTCPSPALLHLFDVSNSIVVIIDVLRATSTIATALHNGAKEIIPVDNVSDCIHIGKELGCITAGERDGKVAEGLQYGNSPFEYSKEFIANKTMVLTTTNGTKLLHMAHSKGAKEIITGSFPNISAVCKYLIQKNTNVILGCAAWKDKVNIEDTLFAGAIVNRIKQHFLLECDFSQMAESLYLTAKEDLFNFMKERNATHYHRLTNFGLEKDIRYCLTNDTAPSLPFYSNGKLVNKLL
ncbi:MAG: 2-phosphosulfolactate phosphatase [Ferruginibacter sp.]|nr:2-phosphosulfolactate phosphatase [Ferruginibacter sp.]